MNLFNVYAQSGADGCGDPNYKPLSTISEMIVNGVKVIVPIGIIIFFVMLLVGGFKYMTAGGDPKAAGSAKGTITFGFVGLGILILGWYILNLVGNEILLGGTGNDIFNLDITGIIEFIGGQDAINNKCINQSTP